ncbi:unnamed protein product [Discula destructiva]
MTYAPASAPLVSLAALPLASVVVTSTLLLGALLTVGIRAHVRFHDRAIYGDDVLIFMGALFHTLSTGLGIYSSLMGIGSRDSQLDAEQQIASTEYYFIWSLAYIVTLTIIKSSVCLSIRRRCSATRRVGITVYALLFEFWWAFGVVLLSTLLFCKPVEAVWRPEAGSCASDHVVMVVGEVMAVSMAVADVSLAVVSAILVCKVAMSRGKKWQLLGLLTFASIALIFTLVRIPCFLQAKNSSEDQKYWLGIVVLLSNVELGVGCIASSAPAIWWNASARATRGQYQSPAVVENFSFLILEAREAEGWGVPEGNQAQSRLDSRTPSEASPAMTGHHQHPATPLYPSTRSMRTEASHTAIVSR